MKKNFIPVALIAAAGFVAVFPAAHAADGTINFSGSVTAQTCDINGGGAGNNFTVPLMPVSVSALATPGEVAGRKDFSITLANCSPDTGLVSTYFEPGPTVNPATGRLIVDAGGASNVEIGLLNADDFSNIVAGASVGLQNSKTADIVAGSATLKYFAEYVATGGAATAGAANSRVQYTLVYQ